MDKDRILVVLREHAPELKAAGVVHLRLFGSVARGEASPHSDVDLLADFDASKRVTLVTMGSLESRLGDLLGAKVDLSSANWMRESIRSRLSVRLFLPFRDTQTHFQDIEESIGNIDAFLEATNFEAY